MMQGKNWELRLDLLKTLKGAITLALDPSRADATPDIEDGLIKLKATQLAIEYIKTLPGMAEIIQERYLAPPPNMEALATLPVGFFRAFGDPKEMIDYYERYSIVI